MSETTGSDLVYMNGINGATGELLSPPTPIENLAAAAKGERWNRAHLDELDQRVSDTATSFAVLPEYGDGSDLQKVGWGIIFPASADAAQVDAILEALDPLVQHRTTLKNGQPNPRCKILRGGDGFRWVNGQPETSSDFLVRHHVAVGPVDPTLLPYYLLIIGDPQSIPFQFQYELDVQYAVGRIFFPRVEDYANYARSVVAAETGQASLARQAVFFGPAHPNDEATRLSAVNLIKPLHEYVGTRSQEFELGWSSQLVEPADANKTALLSLLGGSQTPAFLFTATHGMVYPYNHALQGKYQGGLLCQDWRGPKTEKVRREHFLAAEDLPESANLLGSIVFHFACFGGGTPYWDEFAIAENRNRSALAVRPFLSALPTRLLANPGGGALVVISHIERAWTYSFSWGKLQSATQAYQSLLFHLMDGKPVGKAIDDMNVRYAQIASQLVFNLGELKFNKDFITPRELAFEWAATNDARGYAILGDPAVCAAVGPKDHQQSTRSTITLEKPFPGVLPVVFDPDALEPLSASERQVVQTENQALTDGAGSFTTPPPGGTGPLPTPADADPSIDVLRPGPNTGGGGSAPIQVIQSGENTSPGAPVGQGQPFTTVMDALAVALEGYREDRPVSFALDGNAFTIQETVSDKIRQVVEGLNNALTNLAQGMEKVTSDAATLTVTTGVAEDLTNPTAVKGEPRFVTTISLTGDVQVFVPKQAEEIDATLLALHKEMVNQAMAGRVALVKALGEMVASLFGPQKG